LAAEAAVAEAGEAVRALKAAGATNADEAVQACVATLKERKGQLAALEARAVVGAGTSLRECLVATEYEVGEGDDIRAETLANKSR